jgi:hypothetical protein
MLKLPMRYALHHYDVIRVTENALYITSVVKNALSPLLPPEKKPHHPPCTLLYGPSGKKEKFQFAVGT